MCRSDARHAGRAPVAVQAGMGGWMLLAALRAGRMAAVLSS